MLKANDFVLTDDELKALNQLVQEDAERFALAGEVPDGLSVTFTFTPGFGRTVSLQFDGGPVKEVCLK
jgi:hypothetical protein